MSDSKHSIGPSGPCPKDRWRRIFGNCGVVEPVIALALVSTLCYLLLFRDKDGLLGSFMNILFVVVAFYFRNDGASPNGQG